MRRRESLTPDLTPIIDVVFLILIFFLVSSTFKKDELALELTLPKSQNFATPIKKEDLSIELSVDSVALKGKKLTFEELDTALLEVEDHNRVLNIRIDKSVEYGRVIVLFDLLKKHNLNNLALESEISNN